MGIIAIRPKIEELGKTMDEVTEEIAGELIQATAQLSQLTYNKAVEMTNERLHDTRQQYIDALELEDQGDGVYVVSLHESAHHLDDGYPPFPMLPKLAQGPKSKVAKDGSRYTIIPIRQKTEAPSTASPKRQDLAAQLRAVVAGRQFRKVKTQVDKSTGKVRTVERLVGDAPHKHLQGLTRVREYEKEGGKLMSSAYLTFRVASTKQDAGSKWRHPGFKGAQIFPDLERWADQEMDRIVADIFR
jgi:hypothetical protein